jgi:colanic acid biosynthesis glycosyl transferase WcaI
VAHRLARTADEVIVPTPGLVADLERHGARHVHVLPGPVLDGGATAEERRAARSELGLADGTCAVVYAGAIGVANGLDLLLDAVRDLPPHADTTVLVAGDGSARASVEQRLSSESIARVRMLGPIPKDDVRRLLAAADVCLHLLRPDPLFATAQPTKMLEYFGAHRAVITTVPGLPEQLATASGGGFAPSAAALSAELERWTALAPEERLRRGDAAFEFGSARFGLDTNVDAFERLLGEVSLRGGAKRRGGAD